MQVLDFKANFSGHENRNSNITTQLACVSLEHFDFAQCRRIAQIREEIEKVNSLKI